MEGKYDDLDTPKYIDVNYEELSPDRSISNQQLANGLINFNFSVAPSGGGAVLPHMSYILCEYSFGEANPADPYTANAALTQDKKIALQNNWTSCLFNACRFTVAQSEVSVINSSYAQANTLLSRLSKNNEYIEKLGYDLNGYDPDFSRRLARTCKDGVYHRDGLIDCSPYNSTALSSLPTYGNVVLTNQNQKLLAIDPATNVISGTSLFGDTTNPIAGNFAFIFSGIDGAGAIAFGAANGAAVLSFLWYLGPFSATPGTFAQNEIIVNGGHINNGDEIVFRGVGGNVPFNSAVSIVHSKRIVAGATILVMNLVTALTVGDFKIAFGNANGEKVGSGITLIKRYGASPYTQPDPRSNQVNKMVMFQPTCAFFGTHSPDVYFGDMNIQLTPNANWAQACIESAVSGSYYNTDVKHGVDYSFGIKSMRLYLARARLLEMPEKQLSFSIEDIQISNKQLPNGSSTLNFTLPTSTRQIAIWIQDSACGSNSKLPLTRFKTRQYTGVNAQTSLSNLNAYGPWSHTYDERLQSIQINFAGLNKPVSLFNSAFNSGSPPTTNTMLQRWIMNNQMNGNKQTGESFNDWLSCGPYYYFDFSRSADNLGTYMTVSITYNGDLPTDGITPTSGTPSNVNLYVASLYARDVAISYGEYGQVVSVQTQQR
jgi:hypothetical protein